MKDIHLENLPVFLPFSFSTCCGRNILKMDLVVSQSFFGIFWIFFGIFKKFVLERILREKREVACRVVEMLSAVLLLCPPSIPSRSNL